MPSSNKVRTLWRLTRGQRTRYAAAVLAMAAGIFLLYLSPQIVRGAIDGLIAHRPGNAGNASEPLTGVVRLIERLSGGHTGRGLLLAGGCVVAVTGLSGAFNYLRGRWAATASESIARRLRERLYGHLQHAPVSYHDTAQTGDLVQRCTSDVDTVRTFYANQVVEISRAVLLLLTAMPILLRMDWRMALVAVALMPVILVFSLVFFSRVQGTFKSADEAEGKMTTVLQENLTGIRVVRAFARQEFEKSKFADRNQEHRRLAYRLFVVMAFYWAASDWLVLLQTAAVLLVGAWRVAHETMTVGTFVAFLQYEGMMIWPVRQLGRILTEVGKALVSLGRVQEILDQPEESEPETPIIREGAAGVPLAASQTGGATDEPGQRIGRKPWAIPASVVCEAASGGSPPRHPRATPDLPRSRGEIRLRDVSFSHAGRPILDRVSLTIPAGSSLALLGPSGAGKSTLVNLLLRFYDYDEGSITLDGVELKHLPRKYVRSQFAVVMQEPFLYSKTLRENIVLGRHSAAESEAIEAASAAAIHESIEAFDKRYDTLVGERGVTLSGGQRQRVAIARALLRDAPVLALDDALSAVDTRTESDILGALGDRRGRHTTILIAHRLSTLRQADRVVVLEHGRVTQSGTHDQLVAEEGLYRRLWQIQGTLEEDLREEMSEVVGG